MPGYQIVKRPMGLFAVEKDGRRIAGFVSVELAQWFIDRRVGR